MAIDQGARQATHVFNGMPPLSHREPGVLSTVLSDERVYVEVIVDGIHVHPQIVALLLKALGPERMVLVSDAMRAAGLGDGVYALGDQDVVVRDGVTRRPDGGLAGSVLTLDSAVRHIAEYARLPLPQAIRLATETPARAMGWDDVGSLREGSHADFVALDRYGVVAKTWVGGELVYSAPSDPIQTRTALRGT
jgi:N-acetylglucosamine-6-phosphate deacetylase